MDHRLEMLERQAVIIGIKGCLVVFFAKFGGIVIPFMVLEPVARMAISAQVVEEVIALKQRMMLHHPKVSF